MLDLNQVTPELITKYNVVGPRYTSYPTVPNWERGDFSVEYKRYLNNQGNSYKDLSFYIHLPFCSRLCTFCGCNKFITNDADLVDRYLDSIAIEIGLVADQLKTRQKIAQFHLGGGTPTHLTPKQLERIYHSVAKYFDFTDNAEFAIEAHPRVTTEAHLKKLYKLGWNRVSLGVQDLNSAVQEAINRRQTLKETVNTFNQAREIGYKSINIDLVYGLPKQTLKTWEYTMAEVLKLKPDRLAIYSFAYIPSMMMAQEKAIVESELPLADEKIALYIDSIKTFLNNDYEMIGMDHYALKTDELAIAKQNKTLHRNFMGYTTQKGLAQIGIGVSSISDFGDGYFQNQKDLRLYMETVNNHELGIICKKELNRDDIIRREVIEQLMCLGAIDFKKLKMHLNIDFLTYFKDALSSLQFLKNQNLISLTDNHLLLTDIGGLFVRNIAMVFDPYLKGSSHTFSKTV